MRIAGAALVAIGLVMAISILALSGAGCSKAGPAGSLHIRGTPGLEALVADLAAEFQSSHPSVTVAADCACPPCVVGSKGQTQTPVDLWLAWGQFDIDHYASEGGTTFERTTEVGSSRLALAVPKDLEGRVKSISDLTDPSVKSIMVGDPETVAVGHHAKQALEALGLWSRIESRLDINRSGCEMLKSLGLGGSGKVAIVFAACVGPANESVTIAEVLPDSAEPPIPLVAGIPTQAPHADTARQFLESLGSGGGVATLTRHGIVPAPH